MVRIRFPPAESQQTFGSARDFWAAQYTQEEKARSLARDTTDLLVIARGTLGGDALPASEPLGGGEQRTKLALADSQKAALRVALVSPSLGIEAVSNNVQSLAEPRVTTGKWTMFYMAVSLSFTAGGIILLYLLWHVAPVEGQTLNAVTFRAILATARAIRSISGQRRSSS